MRNKRLREYRYGKKFVPERDDHYYLNDGSRNTNFGLPKRLLVISFSGGRTSAYMTWKLLQKYKGIRRIVVVFANTGEERCLQYYRRGRTWLQCIGIKVSW